jgi:hypothetical protein
MSRQKEGFPWTISTSAKVPPPKPADTRQTVAAAARRCLYRPWHTIVPGHTVGLGIGNWQAKSEQS